MLRLIALSALLPFSQIVYARPASYDSTAVDGTLPEWQYYLAADATTHKVKVRDLTTKGYRIISLAASGSVESTQYAAVWVSSQDGPEFSAIHDVDASAYQTWFDKNKAEGYVPTQISVVGEGNATIYAGVMEKSNMTEWTQECDLDANRFEGYDQRGRAIQQSLKVFTKYGSASDPKFCAIWHANPDRAKWARAAFGSKEQYDSRFKSETVKPYWHPSFVAVSADSEYAAVYTDNSIGDWSVSNGLTAAELKDEVNTQKLAGRHMIQISAGGPSADNTLYGAIFATEHAPLPRTWRVNGIETNGFKDNAKSEKELEERLKEFMQFAAIRQAQLSMRKGDKLLYSKAFTWSEEDRPTTQVNDTFLLASVSKAFATAAITTLYDAGKLTPDTKVYSLLGYKNGTAPDPRQFDITVQHLVDHQGGTSRTVSIDQAFNMRALALEMSGGAHPLTMNEFVDYMFAQQLDFTPGETSDYSNYGYVLLSYIVQNVTGIPYYTYLEENIIKPEGLNVKQWLTNADAHKDDNVLQESANIGLSVLEPLSDELVPAVYGGDGQYKESLVGTTGLAADTQSLTKFLLKYNAFGTGGPTANTRSGTVEGARTTIEHNSFGIDWALAFNTRAFPNGEDDHDLFVNKLSSWLYDRPEIED